MTEFIDTLLLYCSLIEQETDFTIQEKYFTEMFEFITYNKNVIKQKEFSKFRTYLHKELSSICNDFPNESLDLKIILKNIF